MMKSYIIRAHQAWRKKTVSHRQLKNEKANLLRLLLLEMQSVIWMEMWSGTQFTFRFGSLDFISSICQSGAHMSSRWW